MWIKPRGISEKIYVTHFILILQAGSAWKICTWNTTLKMTDSKQHDRHTKGTWLHDTLVLKLKLTDSKQHDRHTKGTWLHDTLVLKLKLTPGNMTGTPRVPDFTTHSSLSWSWLTPSNMTSTLRVPDFNTCCVTYCFQDGLGRRLGAFWSAGTLSCLFF
jgi:hypothetical protein